MSFLDSLNPAQKEAVTHVDGALLILAGAGSGKTKTLTTRLTYLLCEAGIPPQNTLTLTFTNKAAKEMRERAIKLIEDSNLHLVSMPLLCTFHKFGLLFLQHYMQILNRSTLFNVIDEEDKRKILRDIKKQHTQAATIPAPSILSDEISLYKNARILPNIDSIALEEKDVIMMDIYGKYEEYLVKNNLIDFDDLLLLPYRILEENQDLRRQISQKYQYIMVDEYQDTNDLQVALLKQLCFTHQNICVVGDDDQSIYSWRGANIRNILEFHKDFVNPKTIKLEENYRSTQEILSTANNLIAHNTTRHNKILRATKPQGEKVQFFSNPSDTEEMRKIIESIQKYIAQGESYDDIAILFRLNGLSRNVEANLNRAKIPFTMIGVIRFYERQEIKDVIAYLRLALNPNDNFSFTRVINRPRRGIGDKTLQNILQLSENAKGVYEAFCNGQFATFKQKNKLESFFHIIESLRDCIATNLRDIEDIFDTQIKLYSDEDISDIENNNEFRRQNMKEFFESFQEFIAQNEEKGVIQGSLILQDFLNNITLSSSSDDMGFQSVKCMSIHNSKGLEFKHVFVIGLEENLFPLRNFEDSFLESSQSTSSLAEERRLAYVAFTRAKETLTLSYAKSRLYRNHRRDYKPSYFLKESGLLSQTAFNALYATHNTEIPNQTRHSHALLSPQTSDFKKGDCIQHKIFGFGRIESVQGVDKDQKATINFSGTKRIILVSFLTKV